MTKNRHILQSFRGKWSYVLIGSGFYGIAVRITLR